MTLLDLLESATESFHAEVDLGSASKPDYRRYLTTMYGYVLPVERAARHVAGLTDALDPRRLRKHALLRSDLAGLGMSVAEIDAIPLCPVAVMTSPEDVLGWLYPIERGTRAHTMLFHRLALAIPGDVAYASSFLKCYFGAVGEVWRELEVALALCADTPARSRRLLAAARAGFEMFSAWQRGAPLPSSQPMTRVA